MGLTFTNVFSSVHTSPHVFIFDVCLACSDSDTGRLRVHSVHAKATSPVIAMHVFSCCDSPDISLGRRKPWTILPQFLWLPLPLGNRHPTIAAADGTCQVLAAVLRASHEERIRDGPAASGGVNDPTALGPGLSQQFCIVLCSKIHDGYLHAIHKRGESGP